MSVCADTRREWTVLASHDANDGDIPLGVRGRNQSESHDSLPKLTEYFEETLVTFAQMLDSRGGEQGVREKVVKEMVVSLMGDGGTSVHAGWLSGVRGAWLEASVSLTA